MVNDEFGIKKLYPTSTSNEQSAAFPDTTSEGHAENIAEFLVTEGTLASLSYEETKKIGWFEFEPDDEDMAELLILPSSLRGHEGEVELELDCEMNHQEAHERGYVNDSGEWQNVEMTSHFFVKSVSSNAGFIFFEARSGFEGGGKSESGCCQDTAYGVRLYWDNSATGRGKFAFYKKVMSGAMEIKPKQAQAHVPTFYQEWFAAKFVIYNMPAEDFEANPSVKLELWLSPAAFFYPGHAFSNQWTKVGEIIDRIGSKWADSSNECDAPEDDFPVTWAAPFISFGWEEGKIIQFMYSSFREIDPAGSFGEDPDPDPTDPDPDPTTPPPDPDPNQPPTSPPPDAEPPKTPTTVTKRLTIRREIQNNRNCTCDGQNTGTGPPPDPGGGGGGGGGGGTGTISTLYDVKLSTKGFAKLAKVEGNSSYYLRFGQGVTQANSRWINKRIVRVEMTIAEFQNPRGGTGGGVHCRIRNAATDSIVATLSPVATEENILNAGIVHVFENLQNDYKMQFGDKLLFEYDGGDKEDYIKIFRRPDQPNTGTKIVWQSNTMDAGDYGSDDSLDTCMRVYTITGTVNTSLTTTDTTTT